MFHGGGTRKARAAGQRRLAETAILKKLAAWEKQQAARDAALAPWADEVAFRAPNVTWASPKDLRRIAREMTDAARALRDVARGLEQGWIEPYERFP